jgi:hypothetical protein
MPSKMKRLPQLEEEHAKRIVADLSLDKAMLQDVISRKPDRQRRVVDDMRATWRVSIDGPVRCCRSSRRPTTTSAVVVITRPFSHLLSRQSRFTR